MNSEQKIKTLLWSLGASGSYTGVTYLAEGIEKIINDRSSLTQITKSIYMPLAKKHKTRWKNIERNMRTAIKVIWNHGNRELLDTIAYKKLKARPKNGVFMEMIADYIIEMEEAAAAKEE